LAHKVETSSYVNSQLKPVVSIFEDVYRRYSLTEEGKDLDLIFFEGKKDYPVGGVFESVKILPYVDRVLAWRPICSQFDDETGKLLMPGAEFLKHRFVEYRNSKGEIMIIPRRDHRELYPRLIKPTSSLRTIADHILKIRAFMFSSQQNLKFYNELKVIHDALLKIYGHSEIYVADLNKSRRDKAMEKMRYKLGVQAMETVVSRCPTFEEVNDFYLINDFSDYHKRSQYSLRKTDFSTIFDALRA